MVKAIIKRILRLFIIKLMDFPGLKRLGQRVLHPFPKLKGWVIRLVQAGKCDMAGAPNRIEGVGDRQQRLLEGLEYRGKQDSHG